MSNFENYKKERKEIAMFMRRLYRQGLTTTSGGNISLKISEDIILITPSATDKGRMRWNEVGILNIKGENLIPALKPSIETEMHLSIYRKNKDVKAIVHAHPVFASAFTATKFKINTKSYRRSKGHMRRAIICTLCTDGDKTDWRLSQLRVRQNLMSFYSKTMGYLPQDRDFFRHSINSKYWRMQQK